MAVKLDNVVPLGRSLDEYARMFCLTERELQSNIVSVADGPASFNAELTARGGRVTSVDPIYRFARQDIRDRFEAALDAVIAQVAASKDDWNWSYHGTPEGLRQNRVRAMELFAEDYASRRNTSAYVDAELPALPFADRQFDLALCSHFLFLYSEHFSAEFHLASIMEMLRIAPEVRVFPLLELNLQRSRHLDALLDALQARGDTVAFTRVEFEFQRGGNEMLVVTSV